MSLKTKNVPIKRWWDIWIALAVLTAISIVGARLWVTEWTGDLYILIYVIFFAGVTGLALGYSKFSYLVSALVSLIYGIFITSWLFGTTVQLEMSWRYRLLNYLGWRLRIAIVQFFAGETLSDPILFLAIMAALMWTLGSIAAFILIREGSAWPTLIPLGLSLLVIGQYDQNLTRNTLFLMAFVFCTLLLIGRMTFLRFKEKWRAERIYTNSEIHADFSKSLLILVAVLLALAWIIPVTPRQASQYSELWQTIKKPWDRLNDKFSDIFMTEATPEVVTYQVFGESMGLGRGTPASEETVFTVKVDTAGPDGYRNYWRARSYDYYADADWSTNAGLMERQIYPNNFNITYPEWDPRQTAKFTFTNQQSRMVNLYAPGLPTWVNRPATVISQALPASEEEDLIALLAEPELITQDTYQVETQVFLPTETQLRMTGTNYPVWLNRYLQLPDDFSPEIASLAGEIAEGLGNPYDIARAVTRYLRLNIEYSRTIPPVPTGADPMEWFLFEEQSGFCNYYATAQVLMLRSLGIPARMAVGYAEGEYDDQAELFNVRKRDSHAWPEVFFVGYGWVIFEPTVSQPALILPSGQQRMDDLLDPLMENIPELDSPQEEPDVPMDIKAENETAETPDKPFFGLSGSQVIWSVLGLVLISLLITIFVLINPAVIKINLDPLPVLLERWLENHDKRVPKWLRQWSIIARMSIPEKAYLQMGRSIRILGHSLNPSETPIERAHKLTNLLPQLEQPVQEIISEYHLDKFSNHIVNEERATNAARQVQRMALKTRLREIFQFNRPI